MILTAWSLTQLFRLRRNTCDGWRRYWSYSSATPQHEGHGVEQTVILHQEVALGHALLAARVRKNPFMRHILTFYSVSGYNTTPRIFMKETLKLFEDSYVTKTDLVCSVIAAQTISPTFYAADLNYLWAYLQVQRPGSNRLRFSSD